MTHVSERHLEFRVWSADLGRDEGEAVPIRALDSEGRRARSPLPTSGWTHPTIDRC